MRPVALAPGDMRAPLVLVPLVALLAAGCASPASGPSGWRIFDASNDGCECARTIGASPHGAFDFTWTGQSPGGIKGGLKAYFEQDLPVNKSLVMTFQARPNASLSVGFQRPFDWLAPQVGCVAGQTPAPVNDSRFDLSIVSAPQRCEFRLVLHQPLPPGNGIRLIWYANSIAEAGSARDPAPANETEPQPSTSTPANGTPTAISTTPTIVTVAPQFGPTSPIEFEARAET